MLCYMKIEVVIVDTLILIFVLFVLKRKPKLCLILIGKMIVQRDNINDENVSNKDFCGVFIYPRQEENIASDILQELQCCDQCASILK